MTAQQHQMCLRKVRHETQAEANEAIRKAQAERGVSFMRSYRCPHCNGWHLTKRSAR